MAKVRVHRLEARIHSRAFGRRLVTKVTEEIKLLAVFETSFGPYTTGNLARHMASEVVDVPNGVRGRVYNRLPYARAVHDGARIHVIRPRPPRSYLKFYWRRVGKTVFFSQIPASSRTAGRSHPGLKGKKYLTKHLATIARRNNMRYIIYER